MKSNVNGVVNIYKEKGFTSHDVVAKLRGIFKIKKIGHTGTLDPDAEGVLPVCIGNATKLCELIMEKDKIYVAELILGKQTDTQDISGEILNSSEDYNKLTENEIKEVILSFIGEYDQTPPMYSALKVNGKKLYEYAREGIEIERKKRKVSIYDIEILSIELPVVKISVHCSKGTYIRTLCNDIGEKLGVCGCMGQLLRTKSGRFELAESHKLSEIEDIVKSGKLDEADILIAADNVLSDYDKLFVKKEFEKLLLNGNPLPVIAFKQSEIQSGEDKELFRVYDSEGKFVAVYRFCKDANVFKNQTMFSG